MKRLFDKHVSNVLSQYLKFSYCQRHIVHVQCMCTCTCNNARQSTQSSHQLKGEQDSNPYMYMCLLCPVYLLCLAWSPISFKNVNQPVSNEIHSRSCLPHNVLHFTSIYAAADNVWCWCWYRMLSVFSYVIVRYMYTYISSWWYCAGGQGLQHLIIQALTLALPLPSLPSLPPSLPLFLPPFHPPSLLPSPPLFLPPFSPSLSSSLP